jgi:tripartite-type tricarboxylate transporter receptor subunit TctC
METTMQIKRRDFVHLTALAAAASGFGLARVASGQTPAPLLEQAKFLVGFPPGGGTDTSARRITEGVRGDYARVILVENKPGAGATLVIDDTVRGPIDGSIVLVQPESAVTLRPYVEPKTTHYKFSDLVPVAAINVFPQALAVGPAVPESVRTWKDFLAWAKANPGKGTYGTPAPNSTQDFLIKAAMKVHGFDLLHVPYKGSAPAIQDLLGGQIAATYSPVGDSMQYVGPGGKLRVIGTSGPKRSQFAPDAPTFTELGYPQMELIEGFGIWMKAGVPEAIQDRLHAGVQKVLAQKDVVDFFAKTGLEAAPMSRQDFVKTMQASDAAWVERIRITGFKPAP